MVAGKRLKAQWKSPSAPGDLGYARLGGYGKGLGVGEKFKSEVLPAQVYVINMMFIQN